MQVNHFLLWLIEEMVWTIIPEGLYILSKVHLISVGGMAQGGEWSRLNNQGQTFLRVYTFSPGCTLISVGGMSQGGEWSRLSIP
jgi:hypothetical protein